METENSSEKVYKPVTPSGLDTPGMRKRRIGGLISASVLAGAITYNTSDTFHSGVDIVAKWVLQRVSNISAEDIRSITRS